MLKLRSIHHVAIICANYEKSKNFYTEILGFKILGEHHRRERGSWKLDLALENDYAIELFSFPDPPSRLSGPEACGLRHLAFSVSDIDEAVEWLRSNGVIAEEIRTDDYTSKKFTFFRDPDNLPLELYEQP